VSKSIATNWKTEKVVDTLADGSWELVSPELLRLCAIMAAKGKQIDSDLNCAKGNTEKWKKALSDLRCIRVVAEKGREFRRSQSWKTSVESFLNGVIDSGTCCTYFVDQSVTLTPDSERIGTVFVEGQSWKLGEVLSRIPKRLSGKPAPAVHMICLLLEQCECIQSPTNLHLR
jgi:hypothetical protein